MPMPLSPRTPRCPRAPRRCAPDLHVAAPPRVLDGVRHQVLHDAPQLFPVGHDDGDVGVHARRQAYRALLRQESRRLLHRVYEVHHVDRLDGQRRLPRLAARHFQDVVDHVQKQLALSRTSWTAARSLSSRSTSMFSHISAKARMDVSGVLSSWLMVARKSDLNSFVSCRTAFARSSCSRRCSSSAFAAPIRPCVLSPGFPDLVGPFQLRGHRLEPRASRSISSRSPIPSTSTSKSPFSMRPVASSNFPRGLVTNRETPNRITAKPTTRMQL